MMSTRLSTKSPHHGCARARYVYIPRENAKLSDDLDIIVKLMALNSCKEILHCGPNAPFLLKTRQFADSGAHVSVGHAVAFPHGENYEVDI
jgi:hypothetical protein